MWQKLEQERVNPQFYALRWLMLLMCQEFDMANCVRLWDTLFADPHRYEFLNYVCVAIIIEVREEILEGDFAACMENLQAQTKRVNDVQELLNHAQEVRETHEALEQEFEELEADNGTAAAAEHQNS